MAERVGAHLTDFDSGRMMAEASLANLEEGSEVIWRDVPDGAAVFAWPTKGNLVFQFDAPRPVDGVRLRVGADAGTYAAIAYLGVEFGESGQTETGDGKMVADVYDFAFEAQTWVELEFPPDTQTDYIELITEAGAEFYEIEILSSATPGTEVRRLSWGQVKIVR